MYPIRTSAKAIIVNNKRILLIRKEQDEKVYYTFPGGGQNHNESLEETVKRECLEEVGYDVLVGDIIFIRDYIANNHEFRDKSPDFHQLEMMFECTVLNINDQHEITEADENQTGMVWLSVDEIPTANIYPKAIRKSLVKYLSGKITKGYLGAVN